MKTLILIFLLTLFPQKEIKYYKHNRPTSKGVDNWIELHQWELGEEYQRLVKDTLYDYFIWGEDLTDYVDFDSTMLGMSFLPSEAIVHNKANFIDYAVDSISKFRRKTTTSNAFVKGTVFHELSHVYVNQILREMQYLKIPISTGYRSFRIYSSRERNFGASFIEEGICEYIPNKLGEILLTKNPYKPVSLSDIDESYRIKYVYSEYFVRDFLDQFSVPKEGIIILFSNPPPTKEEILHPEKYFQRLERIY